MPASRLLERATGWRRPPGRFESVCIPARADSARSWTVNRAQIEARNFDLKAVNPNARVEEDLRTPAELLDIVEAKQKETADVIAALRSQN